MGFFLGDSYIGNIPEAVSGLITSDEEQDERISDLEEKVRQALASVFVYKGSVATYSDLPADDNKVGDTYNVLDTGDNYTWNGTGWDKLAGIVDLSHLVTLDTAQTITAQKTFDDTPIKFLNDHGDERSIYADQGGLVFDSEGSGSVAMDYTGSFYPVSGNYKYLGYSTEKWARAYIEKYFDGNNASYGFTLPDSTALTADAELLDTASAQTISGVKTFSNGIYFAADKYIKLDNNNKINIYFENTPKLLIDSVVQPRQDMIPFSNNAFALGSTSYAWKDLYLTGKVRFAGINYDSHIINDGNRLKIFYANIERLRIGNSEIAVSNDFLPYSTSIYSLGNYDYHWKDLYIDGDISNGTESATVQDIAALIAYAKAQGWIS